MKRWMPKTDIIYSRKKKNKYPYFDKRDPNIESLQTNIKVFFIDKNRRYPCTFQCKKDEKCNLEYSIRHTKEKEVKGLLFKKKVKEYEYETVKKTIPIKDLDFRKKRKNLKKTYHDSHGTVTVLEHKITYTVSIRNKTKDTYKKRLMRGESELSAKGGLDSYENVEITESELKALQEYYDEQPEKKKPPKTIKERVTKKRLTRPANKFCPKCNNELYNTRLDGEYLYCPKCKKQYNKSFYLL